MAKKKKSLKTNSIFETLLITFLLSIIVILIFNLTQKPKLDPPVFIVESTEKTSPTQTPKSTPKNTSPSSLKAIDSQISPDGEFTLILKSRELDKSTQYSFFVQKKDSSEPKLLYTTTRPKSLEISIPFNAWSPDNQYVFWQEKLGRNPNYFVIKANLEEKSEPFNIGSFFYENYPDYKMINITGWNTPQTLFIETTDLDDNPSHPFYFDAIYQSLY